jgi:hypothetical protein
VGERAGRLGLLESDCGLSRVRDLPRVTCSLSSLACRSTTRGGSRLLSRGEEGEGRSGKLVDEDKGESGRGMTRGSTVSRWGVGTVSVSFSAVYTLELFPGTPPPSQHSPTSWDHLWDPSLPAGPGILTWCVCLGPRVSPLNSQVAFRSQFSGIVFNIANSSEGFHGSCLDPVSFPVRALTLSRLSASFIWQILFPRPPESPDRADTQ